MSVTSGEERAARANAIARLLDAAIRALDEFGFGEFSVQRVADLAGTSKALVHYHFDSKEALLSECAHRLAADLAASERDAIVGATASTVLDAIWNGIELSATQGRRGAMLALSGEPSLRVRAAVAEAFAVRREAATETTRAVFAVLGVPQTVPPTTVACAYLALADGISLDLRAGSRDAARRAFDVFWLGVLSVHA